MFEIPGTGVLGAVDGAALTVRTVHRFDSSADDVFGALDADDAWRWLVPTCGVDYVRKANDGCDRGVGMAREMGTVRRPLRWLWRQHEEFVEYEAGRLLRYEATRGTWPLLRLWVEEYRIEPVTASTSELTWTVWFTPVLVGRLPLRWLEPALRVGFALGIRPGLKRAINRRAA